MSVMLRKRSLSDSAAFFASWVIVLKRMPCFFRPLLLSLSGRGVTETVNRRVGEQPVPGLDGNRKTADQGIRRDEKRTAWRSGESTGTPTADFHPLY